MNKEKSVQIPEWLFVELCKYFLLDIQDNTKTINKGLSSKLDAIAKHELYSKYKTAPTAEEQEKARQEYLDKAGIPDSFQCYLKGV